MYVVISKRIALSGDASRGLGDPFCFGRLSLCFLVGFIVLLCLVIADEQELHQTYKGW